ncbi:hypothetical protein Tco_0857863 [Tanacetum coccineum]|uniref:RNA-directed DNA polymerase, eukaryota n=1 Tax=Tanacetum coccineum TaxID=301880 RepID=A0ABQ5B7F5_9ASTR
MTCIKTRYDNEVKKGDFKSETSDVDEVLEDDFEDDSQKYTQTRHDCLQNRNTVPTTLQGYTLKDGIETFCNNGFNKGSKDDVAESVCSGHFKKSVNPRTGGSILNLMEELVKVGQTMGYNMDGCMNNMTEIIESQGVKEGFNKLVEDAWNEAPVDESNAMSNMMKKLKYLKQKIRDWNKGNMKSSKNIKAKLKDDLKAVDDIIDNGEGNDEVVKLRMDVLKSIQDIDKIQSLDAAQKAKIKWSIEGDENSSFYHGVLNKKRSQLNIRGILVDGTWVDNPQRVKNEFLHHFSKRFDKPAAMRASLFYELTKILSCDQQFSWELKVSKVKLKRAVWDCGTDKAPGPDGFTFGFYRRFWKVETRAFHMPDTKNPDATVGLESLSIRRIQCIGYGVLGFLGVGITFDIFQNIHILYLQYDVLVFTGYGVLNLFPLWSLVSAGTDTTYWLSE